MGDDLSASRERQRPEFRPHEPASNALQFDKRTQSGLRLNEYS